MAVTLTEEIPEGRGGKLTAAEYTLTRVFRVHVNATTDGPITVAGGVFATYGVRAGAAHPEDATAKCISMDPQDEGNGRQWLVTCTYNNGSENRNTTENPLSDAAIIGPWDSENYQEVAELDTDDELILNSAGDPFDPPLMKDFSRRNVTVRKNVASVPSWFLSYEDAINSDEFTIGGLTIPIGKAKCKRTQVSEAKVRNGTTYYEVTTVIQFSKKGWKRRVLDSGFRQLSEDGLRRVKITVMNDADPPEAEYVAAPVPLDGSGHVVVAPSPTSAYYLEFDIDESLPFSVLPLS